MRFRTLALAGTFFCLFPEIGAVSARTDPFPGRVLDIRPERGQATIRFSEEISAAPGDLGFVQSRRGPIDFRVSSILNDSDILVREDVRGTMAAVQVGDRAMLYPSKTQILEQSDEIFRRIDALLEETSIEEGTVMEQAPDLLADVTDETLLDYETWLLQLEAEEIPTLFPEEEAGDTEKEIPTYPDLEVSQTFRTGVDYDQFVFHATSEAGAPRVARRQIGRFARWNYVEEGDLDSSRNLFFENEMELNQDFFYEEMNYTLKRELPGGDRFWWDSRSVWKKFQNDQGDDFVQENLEVRYVRKLSEQWQWQRGIDLDVRHEYATDRNDGYIRGTFVSEWNYREGFEKWMDIQYELTREIRLDSDNRTQDYWEHRLIASVFKMDGDVSLNLDGDFYYRDYNQPGSEEDEFLSVWTATYRRRIDDEFSSGWRLTLEPRFYPTTDDLNSHALRAELARLYEYSKGTELFVTVEPRFGQVFHFGNVPNNIPLGSRLPRDKSDGDYREAGVNFSLSWFPNDRWRVNLFEDVFHRWFPSGETGVTAFYLFDFPRLADFTGTYSSLSIDYIPREELQFSFSLSHSKQFYDTYDENESSTFNIGLEAIYRF